jgi:formylglycine-generating enzyme required for sulfatase activity
LFHQSYSIAKDGRGRRARIIREDLESQFKSIPPPEGGWDHVEVGHKRQPDNQPRTVKLDGPFEVCAYPVTRRLYALFDPQHKVMFRSDLKQYSPHPRCPAISISWYDAMMFAAWTGSRLMNEQEWEYACRANIRDVDSKSGPLSKYFWKDDPEGRELHDYAWILGNSQRHTWPVDTKAIGSHTNPFKLVDMLGNVWEWTDSLYKAGKVSRVLRGGSFEHFGLNASASCRLHYVPAGTSIGVGFRVARAPKGKP